MSAARWADSPDSPGSPGLYFHGGPAGLRGRLAPPSQTGVRGCADLAAEGGLSVAHVRRDRVFLTTRYDLAVLFAAGHRRPMVYVVTPDSAPEPDPDWAGPAGVSVQTPGALILRTIRPTRQQVAMCRRVLLGVAS